MAPKEEYASSAEFVVTQTPATMQGRSKVDEQRKQDTLTTAANANAPSFLARYACVAFLVSVMAVWWKLSFVEESKAPAIGSPMHSYKIPLTLTVLYVLSLPLLRIFATRFLSEKNGVDVKALLKETMIVYNASQVLLNGWMVYRFLYAILVDGQPFIGDHTALTSTFAVWIHYTDKYLEFFDTFFMVLRGRMDQVSFLHVYHHTSIAWAWWIALHNYPEGDVYFGALCNSFIHIMMYSYYTLSLLKVSCPWKRYLTQAQLVQFVTVNVYTVGVAYFLYKSDSLTLARALGIGVQIFEMTSMLVLFLNFYSGAYRKNGAKTTTGDSKKKSVSTKVSTNETDSNYELPSSQSSLSSDSDEDAITKKEL